MSSLGKWRSVLIKALGQSTTVAKFLCLLHITNNYVVSPTLVYGPSMLPTLNLTGDVLLAERISTRLGKVGLGDVVLVQSPDNPKRIITKRIVGMEGDAVTFLVNPLNNEESHTLVVPKGHIWVQGDNTYASKDSRYFGPVPYGLIQGKVFCRVWPLNAFGSLQY